MKTKILVVTEASFLNTGYAVYGKELISRLNQIPNVEVAEYACYAQPANDNDKRILSIPWKSYPGLPHPHDEQATKEFQQNAELNKFGMWNFEAVCNHFRPNYVLTFRDWWMDSWIANSPYRKYFKWILLAACDALNQNEEWLETYKNVDGLLTYNDWSGQTLINQCNHLNWSGSAAHAPNEAFQILDKKKIREQFGYIDDIRIVGTVMRNQRRKLFPDLFEAFRKYLDLSGDTNTYLYCHTGYPDNGWDFPQLLKEYKLGAKTFFTYVCERPECRYVFPSFFSDMITFCQSCNHLSATMSNVHSGTTPQVLSAIYNTFDLYIQYANSEGLGIPQIEAAACGVPVMSINYSAMEDVISKLQGIPLQYKTLYKEIETGCMRAVPDNDYTANEIKKFFELSDIERKKLGSVCKINQVMNYNWEKTLTAWVKAINDSPVDLNAWNAQPSIHNVAVPVNPERMDNKQFSRWLIAEVLGQPERLGSYMEHRLVKDLNYGHHYGVWGGMYFNEMSEVFTNRRPQPFDRQMAYNHLKMLGERKNHWEIVRCQSQT